eukprot:458732_1
MSHHWKICQRHWLPSASKTKAKPDSKTVRHDSLLHCEDSAYMERSRSRRISSLVGNEQTKKKSDGRPSVAHDSLLHCEDSAYMERSRSRRISSLVGNEQTKKKSDGRPSVAHEGRAASNIKKGRESRKDKRMFGGLRGGFLSKPHGKKNKQKKSNDKPKIAVVKKPVDDQTAYVLPEVQTAMKNSYQSAGDLVTPELVQKIADNPSLLRKIADPRLAQAMAEISKDPKAAKNKYR